MVVFREDQDFVVGREGLLRRLLEICVVIVENIGCALR